MKKTLVALAIALMAGPVSAQLVVPLIADGGDTYTQVGTITIDDDGTDLTVTYEITVADPPWELVETHLGVRTATYDGIKQKPNGNVSPGKFTAGDGKTAVEHAPGTTIYTYTVSLAAIGVTATETIDIAAHAAIMAVQGDRDGPDGPVDEDPADLEESAWGQGPEFADDRNWDMCIPYDVVIPITD